MMTKEKWLNLSNYNKLSKEDIDNWIKKGNNINEKDDYGNNALILTSIANNDNIFIFKYLIQNGADIYSYNIFKCNSFYYACIFNNIQIIKYLLNFNININYQTNKRWTYLHGSAFYKNFEIIKILLDNNINVFIKNDDNKIALYYLKNNIKGIKLFLQSKQYSNKIKGLRRKNISFKGFIIL